MLDHGPPVFSQEPELIYHLRVQCVFSREVWFLPLRRGGWESLAPTSRLVGGGPEACHQGEKEGVRLLSDSCSVVYMVPKE
jgi:hypothetical protein